MEFEENLKFNKREESQDFGVGRLDSERHLLVAHAGPLRARSGPGPGPVLDRLYSSLAVAALPDAGGRLLARLARPTHLRLLHCHRQNHLGPVGSPDVIHAVGQSKQQQHGR